MFYKVNTEATYKFHEMFNEKFDNKIVKKGNAYSNKLKFEYHFK